MDWAMQRGSLHCRCAFDGWYIIFFFLAKGLSYRGSVVKIINTGSRPLVVSYRDDQKPQDHMGTGWQESATCVFGLVGFGGRGCCKRGLRFENTTANIARLN